MNQRIPKLIHPALEKYTRLTDQQLPGLINAFYIVGSIALDGFNPRFSDIDFIAVLKRKLSQAEIECLRTIHKAIETDFPRWKLEGSYIQWGDLGRFDDEVEFHPCYHSGKLNPNGHFELNSVTWWILKNRGIAITGEAPQKLPFTVDWNLLIIRMRQNLNSYWVRWTNRVGRLLVMLSDWGIQWAVLGVLRQYYTFRENAITTKVKSAEYALNNLPPRWHPLVQEAIEIREGGKVHRYHSRVLRMMEAVSFLKYIIQTCNDSFQPIS